MFPRLRALVQSLLEVFPLAAEVFGQVLSVIPLFQGVATSPVYIGVYYCNVVLSPLLSFHWRHSSAKGPEKQSPCWKINTLVSFIDGLHLLADVIWDQHVVAIWQELQNAEKEEWVKGLYFLGIPHLPWSKINDHLTAKVLANKHAIIYLYHPPYSKFFSRSSSLRIQRLLRNMCKIRPQRPEQGRI